MRAGVVAEVLKAGEALPGLRALLVARRGVLVAERYYSSGTAESLQPINSATKSVCSISGHQRSGLTFGMTVPAQRGNEDRRGVFGLGGGTDDDARVRLAARE